MLYRETFEEWDGVERIMTTYPRRMADRRVDGRRVGQRVRDPSADVVLEFLWGPVTHGVTPHSHVPTWLLVYRREFVFADKALRADPLVGDVLPSRARIHAIVRVALGRVVHVATDVTFPLLHLCSLTC